MTTKIVEVVRKIASAFIFVAFASVLFFSLFHLHNIGVTGMSDCPFMSHQETVCPMSLIDHIEAWKTMYIAVMPTIVFVLMVLLLVSIAPNLLFSFPILRASFIKQRLRELTYTFYSRYLQEFFSDGVLNPKSF
ncbi:MAG: hypothetical protein H6779_04295 [Candidatus Nomurabacteria bacterium]|nr:MAG: hypothetical protein H6779_04295 [Candidatus Nomurabacteria bacterium]